MEEESGCPPCSSSPFNGEEEEAKPPPKLLWVRTAPPRLDVRTGKNGSGRRHSGRRIANGAHEGKHGSSGGYTSLRDLLPPLSSVSSPTAAGAPHEGEIPIRNRLVKHAACAYLQPAGARSPRPVRGRGCLRWIRWEAEGCLGFVGGRLIPAVRRAFGRLLAGLGRRTVRGR